MKTTRLMTVSMAAIMALSGVAMAQNAAPVVPSAPSSDAAVNAGVDVDGSATSFDSLMTTINGNAAVDFSTVNEGTTIRVLKLSAMDQTTLKADDLDAALQANAAARSSWPASLEGNAAIKAKLDAEGVAAGDVIAVSTGADGSLTIWVDDRM